MSGVTSNIVVPYPKKKRNSYGDGFSHLGNISTVTPVLKQNLFQVKYQTDTPALCSAISEFGKCDITKMKYFNFQSKQYLLCLKLILRILDMSHFFFWPDT